MERKLVSMVVLSGFIGDPVKHKEPWEQPELMRQLEQARADIAMRITQEENK